MSGANGVDWLTCSNAECIGKRLNACDKCLAHANSRRLRAELRQLGHEGSIDGRGVTISAVLLDRILAAAPRDEQSDRPRFNKAWFNRATFEGGTSFARVIFEGGISLDDATFEGGISFDDATFEGGASFARAIFEDWASFDRAAFEGGVSFAKATFKGWASFDDAAFSGAGFAEATFAGLARFARAAFGNGAGFSDATFGDGPRFENAIFGDRARFWRASFGEQASFADATFGDRASFSRASFGEQASFADATFGDRASFERVVFEGGVSFAKATFGDDATLADATFGDNARFSGTTFGGWPSFRGTTFGDEASFEEATVGDEAGFAGATFGDEASFTAATFGNWTSFGPLLGRGRLGLEQAAFGQGSELAISADRLDCPGMRLPDGGALNLRWAEVWFQEVDIGRPSVLAGVGSFPELNEDPLQPRVARSWRTERPRMLSLRGSDVRNLVLSNVDLRACRFTGAYNLDQLRLEATILLADRPAGWRAGWAVPPLWRWTRRRTLAEEHRWRRAQAKHAGWYPRVCRVRRLAEQERSLRPADLALLYRALRKGREDSKDEPGAADFYYGEMEMRRHDTTASWPERLVLWLYWLVAGYGLRATRAVGCLIGLLAVATILLAAVGFTSAPTATPLTPTSPQQRIQVQASPPTMTAQRPLPDRLGTAALVAVEGAVFRTSDQALTYKGRLIQATLRFVGPVLLGLALLSIRGRVKR